MMKGKPDKPVSGPMVTANQSLHASRNQEIQKIFCFGANIWSKLSVNRAANKVNSFPDMKEQGLAIANDGYTNFDL